MALRGGGGKGGGKGGGGGHHHGGGHRGGRGWGGGWGYPGWYSPLTYVESSETTCAVHSDQCPPDCPFRRHIYRLGGDSALSGVLPDKWPDSAYGQPKVSLIAERTSWCPVHQDGSCSPRCPHRRWARGANAGMGAGMGADEKGGTSNAGTGLGLLLFVGLAFVTGYVLAKD